MSESPSASAHADPEGPCRRGLSPRAVIRRADDGRVLLLQRPASKDHFASRWEFPGGKPDAGETYAETLVRETFEETGLAVILGPVLGVAEGDVDGLSVTYLFVAADPASTGVVIAPEEHVDFRWVDLADLAAMAETPETGEDEESPPAPRLVPAFRTFAADYARRHGYSPPPSTPKSDPASSGIADLGESVLAFKEIAPRYEALGQVLTGLMEELVLPLSPQAIITGRTKQVASFAAKILRKAKYRDPLSEITDLFGLRVITQIGPEVEAVCRLIRERSDLFVIDEKNSEDKRSRLRLGEFGYRSVHYVVRLTENAVPESLRGLRLQELRAEIQVRTQLQHAWADIGHDRLYKGAFKPPARFERESARLAARLEDADEAFTRLVEDLDEYECHFGAYLDSAGMRQQIEVQKAILAHDPGNRGEILRLARLHLALDSPEDRLLAEAAVETIAEPDRTADLWCALGDARRLQGTGPALAEKAEARRAYHEALGIEPGHKGAMIGLAETAVSPKDKLAAWAEASCANPGDPATLSGFIRQKIKVDRDASFLPLLRPSLLDAIEKCRLQVEVRVDLPWALYRMAGFQLLLGGDSIWEAYDSLARAIACDAKPLTLLKDALDALEDLLEAAPSWPGAEAMRRMLLAAIRVKCPADPAAAVLDSLAPAETPLASPVVIVAGGCDPSHEEYLARYRHLLEKALLGFEGTLISGGTRQGIAGLVGGIAALSREGADGYSGIRAVGYLPSHLPSDDSATIDDRYHELRRTPRSTEFSVMEPIQNWVDLLASGTDPRTVQVIGINGGRIAGFEYLLAWALGAKVALVRDSGRVADTFEVGIRNGEYEGMMILPHDAMSVRAFLHFDEPAPGILPPGARDRLARYAHALFLEEGRHHHPDPAMQPWDKLREDLRASNLNQIDHMVRHLVSHGYGIAPLPAGATPYSFGPADEEALLSMAKAEHGRWNVERIRQGWRYGPVRDPAKKLHHCLVSWEELDEKSRSWDFNAIRRFPTLLAQIGLGIVPPDR